MDAERIIDREPFDILTKAYHVSQIRGQSKPAMVGLTSHHANHMILVEGDLLPVRVSRSRAAKVTK